MSCLPGMPCNGPNVYTLYPAGCLSDRFLGYPIKTDLIYYNGPNLPYTGVNYADILNVVIQKIDNTLDPDNQADQILTAISNDPVLKARFCALVNGCSTTTTTTTVTPTTTTTTTTS
jgi:hypothetical protein